MLGLFAYVAALFAAAAGLVLLYATCAGHDRGVVRSRSAGRRSMVAFFCCAAFLTAGVGGVVLFLNVAGVASDKGEKVQLVRQAPTFAAATSTTAPAAATTVGKGVASVTKPVVSSPIEKPPDIAVVTDPPEQRAA